MIQRQVQISKLALDCGLGVVVINRWGVYSKEIAKREKISVIDNFQGIDYMYSSLIPYRSTNFIVRNLAKLLGYIFEFFLIIYYVIFKNAKYIFCNTIDLRDLNYYSHLSKVLRVELIYDYVEFIDSIGVRNKENQVIVKPSFDDQIPNYTDKLIVISDYLRNKIIDSSSNLPMIKIPRIIDFSYFDDVIPMKNENPYFLFCGSAAYLDIIEFIIKSFIGSDAVTKNYNLILVLSGSVNQILKVNEVISREKGLHKVKVLTQLSYIDLVSYYKSAYSLLIPITENLQDKARFPFKICEYSASKRPIITSNSGPILEYFEDNVTAFIAETENRSDFTNKINLAVNDVDLANLVGKNAYKLGLENFSYKAYIKDFKKFISS